ncbi:MAG: hypothetical protein JSR58_08030 [Verrucomicrobia bacterium]|nr:hypothetical protein [Verrucomicrobiota bacterium]
MGLKKIHSDLVQLDYLSTRLEKQKGKTSDAEFEKLIKKIEQKVAILQSDLQEGAPAIVKEEAIQILSALNSKLEGIAGKAREVSHTILQLCTSLEKEGELKKSSIQLKISFFSDIDAPDHNEAISRDMLNAIQSKTPFITTKSLLRGMGIDQKGLSPIDTTLKIEGALLKHEADWDVFMKGAFVIFLPKVLLKDKTGIEKLKNLDFIADGSLQPVTLKTAFQESEKKGDLQSFFALFSPKPQVDKLFYLCGHGGSRSVGGLNRTNYLQFLQFLDKERCRGLVITSCYSGGQSSLMTTSEEEKREIPQFEEAAIQHTFMTLVRSIGDFVTYPGQPSEKEIGLLFDELGLFLDSSTTQTESALRKVIEKVEAGKSKNATNLIRVYFPPTAGVPGGFRTVNEWGTAAVLTYATTKRRKELIVTNKQFLQIHPLVVDSPIEVKGKMPILLSMIPGNGYHLLQKITGKWQDLSSALETTFGFHLPEKLKNTKKAFFITKFIGENNSWENVAILITPERDFVTYKEEGKYFLRVENKNPQPITELEHALLCRQFQDMTSPSEAAVQASGGGQEAKKDFDESLKDSFEHVKKTSPIGDLIREKK